MMIMQFFYCIDWCTFIVVISGKRIDKSVHLPYFWNMVCEKISIRSWWSTHKECSILQEETKHTILTHRAITNISIPNIHSILGKYTIANRKSYLLIPDKKPWTGPKVILVSEKNYREYEKTYYCPKYRIHHKIDNKCDREDYGKENLQCSESWYDPMLTSLIESFFFEL